jgi:hypothetical protein
MLYSADQPGELVSKNPLRLLLVEVEALADLSEALIEAVLLQGLVLLHLLLPLLQLDYEVHQLVLPCLYHIPEFLDFREFLLAEFVGGGNKGMAFVLGEAVGTDGLPAIWTVELNSF